MKHSKNAKVAVLLMLIIECVSTALLYKNNLTSFILSDVFFTWGLIDFLLGLTLIFGFENKMINLNYTKSGNENYIQNVSNFIGASTKNFFKRESDTSAGSMLLILGLMNLVIYAVMLMVIK